MSWRAQFQRTVRHLRRPDHVLRVAIIGIGHELRGDDAAGLAVARALQPYAGEHLLVVEGGSAPENHTGLVRRFAPDLVLLVDAAHVDAPPGTIGWLDWRSTTGVGASTHSLPLHVLAHYLASELGCHVALIGIQPADISLESPLTAPVRQAVAAVVQMLMQLALMTD